MCVHVCLVFVHGVCVYTSLYVCVCMFLFVLACKICTKQGCAVYVCTHVTCAMYTTIVHIIMYTNLKTHAQ